MRMGALLLLTYFKVFLNILTISMTIPVIYDIMSASEPKLAYGERRMSIMNEVHDM